MVDLNITLSVIPSVGTSALEVGKGAAEDFVLVLSPFSARITVKIQV